MLPRQMPAAILLLQGNMRVNETQLAACKTLARDGKAAHASKDVRTAARRPRMGSSDDALMRRNRPDDA